MKEYLLDSIDQVITTTIDLLKNITEKMADKVPTSFPDSIRWNTGHTYFLNELIAFQILGKETLLPEGFKELYGGHGGSVDKNLSLKNVKKPTIEELIKLLNDQKDRIRNEFTGKVHDDFEKPVELPWTKFENVEQMLLLIHSHSSFHKGILERYISILK